METAGASAGQEPVDMGSVRIRLRRLRVTAKEVTGRLEGVEQQLAHGQAVQMSLADRADTMEGKLNAVDEAVARQLKE